MNLQPIKEAKTKRIGKEIQYYEQITSTHQYASQNISKIPRGTLILADLQTDGIGTNGRKWYSAKGENIMMTIVEKPNKNVKSLEGLSLKIAKCVQRTIYDLYGYELTIKYPNDVLLKNKKICGILTSIRSKAEQVESLLISVGFNVNQEKFTEEILLLATSLKKEYKKEFSREEIIAKLIEEIEKEIDD